MKRNIMKMASYVLVAALASCLTFGICSHFGMPGGGKLEELLCLIEEKYVGEADRTAMEDAAAEAILAATGDRWSYYIPAAEYMSYVEQSENAYVGVGITISKQPEDAGFLVVSVEEKGPAAEAGIQPEDLLIAVEDQDVRSFTMEEVRNLVRGEEGTMVELTVLRRGEHRKISVERRKVLVQVASGEMLTEQVGLVTIANFDERCAEETIGVIEQLLAQGAEKLIFDVRNNPGGYANELVEVLDYLLPEGDLFRSVSYRGEESVDRSDADCLDIPMAVLVNRNSYSAAEFFAAAMQEYGAAVLVGECTSGKGFYQNTFLLEDGSAVALSVGKFYTPQGNCLEGVGIRPDVLIEEQPSGEADPYLEKALEALE